MDFGGMHPVFLFTLRNFQLHKMIHFISRRDGHVGHRFIERACLYFWAPFRRTRGPFIPGQMWAMSDAISFSVVSDMFDNVLWLFLFYLFCKYGSSTTGCWIISASSRLNCIADTLISCCWEERIWAWNSGLE